METIRQATSHKSIVTCKWITYNYIKSWGVHREQKYASFTW